MHPQKKPNTGKRFDGPADQYNICYDYEPHAAFDTQEPPVPTAPVAYLSSRRAGAGHHFTSLHLSTPAATSLHLLTPLYAGATTTSATKRGGFL